MVFKTFQAKISSSPTHKFSFVPLSHTGWSKSLIVIHNFSHSLYLTRSNFRVGRSEVFWNSFTFRVYLFTIAIIKMLPSQVCLPDRQPSKSWDIKVCNRERVYSWGGYVRRQENKPQVHLPKGKELGIFGSEEYRVVRGAGAGDWGRKKVSNHCSELQPSSWEAISENGDVRMIWGWCFCPFDINRSTISYLPRPSWRAGGSN